MIRILLGTKIKSRRKSLGLTQGTLAGLISNVGRTGVQKWEKGESMPGPDKWADIEKALEVPSGWVATILTTKTNIEGVREHLDSFYEHLDRREHDFWLKQKEEAESKLRKHFSEKENEPASQSLETKITATNESTNIEHSIPNSGKDYFSRKLEIPSNLVVFSSKAHKRAHDMLLDADEQTAKEVLKFLVEKDMEKDLNGT